MRRSGSLLVTVVTIGLLVVNNVAHCATLTAGTKIQLCKSGDGPWDRKVRQASDGTVYWEPTGIAVDNDGRIYVCDTFRDRILVFTPEGEPWRVIESEQLYHPRSIKVSEDNTLLVTAVVRGKAERIQFVVSYEGEDWDFQALEKVEALGDRELDKIMADRGLVAPFGKDGLRYLVTTGLAGRNLQLVDKDGRHVKSVPSKFFDQKGRYYKSVKDETVRIELGEAAFGIFDESGNLLGKFTARGPRLVKFRGWIYVIEPFEGKRSLLRRYGEDGSVEHEIRLLNAEIVAMPLISPNSEHFLLTLSRGGVLITRLTYQEDQAVAVQAPH